MTDPQAEFDALHPSGHLLFRSCRGGYLHSVTVTEAAMDTDAQSLAQGILLTANVSYLRALIAVRGEIIAVGHTPSAEVPSEGDLGSALAELAGHRLPRREGPEAIAQP